VNTLNKNGFLLGAIILIAAALVAFVQISGSQDSELNGADSAVGALRSGAHRIQADDRLESNSHVDTQSSLSSPSPRQSSTPHSTNTRSVSESSRSQGATDQPTRDETLPSQAIMRLTRTVTLDQISTESETVGSEVTTQLPTLSIPVDSLAIDHRPVMREAPIPVALALPDLEISRCSTEQQIAIQNVRDSFSATISESPTHEPDSPAYFSYWKSAAYLHDEQLKIVLGWQAFNQLSALAAQAAEKSQ
jgi:hypothetical protein